MAGSGLARLSAQVKDQLLQRALQRRLAQAQVDGGNGAAPAPEGPCLPLEVPIPPSWYRFELHSGYQQLRILSEGADRLGIANPYFVSHEACAGATTRIDGREFLNFSSYNYLGLSGDVRVAEAAKDAIDRYGTSVSASRVVSGERPVHRELEQALADVYGVEDAIAYVSGHATNVSTLGCLFGPRDLIVHDALIHNSTLQGAQLSGARRLSFPHNDWAALDDLLTQQRRRFERVLVVVEGLYSMDGDFPDLPRFVDIRRRHHVFLMVDEAHSFGVMGATGRGIREHFGLSGDDVDLWMGTLSKSLAGCGGFIAGSHALVEHLKCLSPGFLYSVGMPPPVAAASRCALQVMLQEPERVSRLQARGQYLLQALGQAGLDTGSSSGLAVVPVLTGGSVRAARLAQALFERRINVQPIVYPAVPEQSARLRFFLTCEHEPAQLDDTAQAVASELRKL